MGGPKLSMQIADEMRDLREVEEDQPGFDPRHRVWTTKRLAERYSTSTRNVRLILAYSRWTGIPEEW